MVHDASVKILVERLGIIFPRVMSKDHLEVQVVSCNQGECSIVSHGGSGCYHSGRETHKMICFQSIYLQWEMSDILQMRELDLQVSNLLAMM